MSALMPAHVHKRAVSAMIRAHISTRACTHAHTDVDKCMHQSGPTSSSLPAPPGSWGRRTPQARIVALPRHAQGTLACARAPRHAIQYELTPHNAMPHTGDATQGHTTWHSTNASHHHVMQCHSMLRCATIGLAHEHSPASMHVCTRAQKHEHAHTGSSRSGRSS